MPGDNKEIKLSFSIDEQSVSRARQVIRDITSDLERLNRAGGTGFFGGGGGNMVGATGTSSTASPSQTQNQKNIAKMPSMTQPLAQTFIAHKNVFESMAKDSKQSMKMMTDGLREAVKEQKRLIEDLAKEAAKLGNEYESVQGGIGSVGKSGFRRLSPSEQAQRSAELVAQRLKNEAAAQKARTDLGVLEGMGGAPAAAGGGGGKGWLAAQLAMGAGQTGALAKVALGRFGPAAVTAWGAGAIAHNVWNDPMSFARSEAERGQMFSRRHMELLGGDPRNQMARMDILRDANMRRDHERLNSGWRRFVHSAKAFATFDFNDAFTGRAADMGVQRLREEMYQRTREADPIKDAVLGTASDYRGTIGTMRAFGVYGDRKRDAVGDSLISGLSAIDRIRRSYSSFSDGEIASGLASIQSQGLRRGRYELLGSVLHGEAAGISGLGAAAGTMARMGGNAAGRNFADYIRRMATSQDVTTAGMVAQFVAQQQGALGVDLGGRGANWQGRGLHDMISTGTAGVGGRLIAEQNIRGAQYLQASLQGQTSPYQAARNVMIAMDSAPNASFYGQSALTRVSLTELADAASGKGGGISSVLKGFGLTNEDAAAYLRGHTASLLEGVATSGLDPDSNQGKLAAAMAGEDPRKFFKSGKWRAALGKGASADDAIGAYAGLLMANDANLDVSSALGLARNITGVGGKTAKAGKTGVAAPGSGTTEDQSIKEQLEAFGKGIEANITHLTNLAGALQTMHSVIQLGWTTPHSDPLIQRAREEAQQALGSGATVNALKEKSDEIYNKLVEKARKVTQKTGVNTVMPGGSGVF